MNGVKLIPPLKKKSAPSWKTIIANLEKFSTGLVAKDIVPDIEHYANTGNVVYGAMPVKTAASPPFSHAGFGTHHNYSFHLLHPYGVTDVYKGLGWQRMVHATSMTWLASPLGSASIYYSMYVAMAYALGFRAQADTMAQLVLANYRNGWTASWEKNNSPIAHLILRVANDWLQGPPVAWGKGATMSEVTERAYTYWRSTELDAVSTALVDLLDYHELRCWNKKEGESELAAPHFQRIPVEVMMILKLRSWLGLENPELVHPLMDHPIAHPPEGLVFEMDDLTQRMYARMQAQGFVHQEWSERTMLLMKPKPWL